MIQILLNPAAVINPQRMMVALGSPPSCEAGYREAAVAGRERVRSWKPGITLASVIMDFTAYRTWSPPSCEAGYSGAAVASTKAPRPWSRGRMAHGLTVSTRLWVWFQSEMLLSFTAGRVRYPSVVSEVFTKGKRRAQLSAVRRSRHVDTNASGSSGVK